MAVEGLPKMTQEVVDVDDYELLKRMVEGVDGKKRRVEVDGQKMMQEVGVEDEQEMMTPEAAEADEQRKMIEEEPD